MKLKYSLQYILFNSVLPLALMVYVFIQRSNEHHLDNLTIFICILFLIISLITAYKFFFGFVVMIDKDEIIVPDYYLLVLNRKTKIESIKKILVRRNVIALFVGTKKIKINKRNISKPDLKNFFDELTSRTGLEIKSYS